MLCSAVLTIPGLDISWQLLSLHFNKRSHFQLILSDDIRQASVNFQRGEHAPLKVSTQLATMKAIYMVKNQTVGWLRSSRIFGMSRKIRIDFFLRYTGPRCLYIQIAAKLVELCSAFARTEDVQVIVNNCSSVLFKALEDLLPLNHAQFALRCHC